MKFSIERTDSGEILFPDYIAGITQPQALDLLGKAHSDGVSFCEFGGHLLMGLTAAAKYFGISTRSLRLLIMNYPRLFAGLEAIRFDGSEKDLCEEALGEPRSFGKVIEALTPLGLLRVATLSTGELAEKLCGQMALLPSPVDNSFGEETLDDMEQWNNDETLEGINAN